jgi:ribonuclease VapC
VILDSSAVIAIALGEQEAARFAALLVDAAVCRISAATWFESSIIVESRGDDVARRQFDNLFTENRIEIVAVSPEQAWLARTAYRAFGKGSGHPAQLNFGDCFSYALAKETGEPLLFKGGDFAHTDIVAAA